IQSLPVRAGEGDADHTTRRRNQTEILAGLVEDLNAGVGGNVQPALGVDSTAVAVSYLERRKIAPVGEDARAFHIECNDHSSCFSPSVPDIEDLVVRTENDSIRADVLRYNLHFSVCACVIDTARCEIRASLAVGSEIVWPHGQSGSIYPLLRDYLALRRENGDGVYDRGLVWLCRAGSFRAVHSVEAALTIQGKRADALRVGD